MCGVTCCLQDVDVECVAILNDTVGCLMSCAFLDHNTEIGVILGMYMYIYFFCDSLLTSVIASELLV